MKPTASDIAKLIDAWQTPDQKQVSDLGMTPNAQHKRAERERRKAAGEVRCEVWLPVEVRKKLVAGCERSGVSVSRAVTMMVNDTY